jgi:hypothetical protein
VSDGRSRQTEGEILLNPSEKWKRNEVVCTPVYQNNDRINFQNSKKEAAASRLLSR